MIRFQPFAPTKLDVLKELPVHPLKMDPPSIRLVRAVVGKIGRKTLQLVEKVFAPGLGSSDHKKMAARQYVVSANLQKLDLPVARARIMPTKEGPRIFFHDPSRGNQNNIFEWVDMDDDLRGESQMLSNFEQISEAIDKHTRKAETIGLKVNPRAWSVYFDEKAKEWKPIIHDFKWVEFIHEKSGPIFDDWRRIEKKLP